MSRKKALSNKLTGPIRVLLVDDNALARIAWKKVLDSSRQIQVIGEARLLDLATLKNSFEPPEILIAGNSFMEAGYLKSGVLRSLWGIRPKVILIVENKEQVKSAFKNGVDFAASKPFDHDDLITWVRSLSDDAKRLCAEYHDRFSGIQAVQFHNNKYADLVGSTLQLLFHPDLVNPANAKASSNLPLSGRLIFRNQAREHKFWIDARDSYKSKYITVDIYNGPLETDALNGLGKYLSESHGLLGLIIGRKIRSNHLQAVSTALFENEKKVILPVDDSQLQAMLEYKAGGVNPAFELDRLYQRLITDAGN